MTASAPSPEPASPPLNSPGGAHLASKSNAPLLRVQLPGGYRLQRLLARTHFSSVWLAAPSPPSPPASAEEAQAGVRWDEGGEACVVIKALDACRSSHAAAAANEAAALRRVAAVLTRNPSIPTITPEAAGAAAAAVPAETAVGKATGRGTPAAAAAAWGGGRWCVRSELLAEEEEQQ
ncbi:hypothetical protein Agub_g10858, partial [Astrephomene gubernaculifera]